MIKSKRQMYIVIGVFALVLLIGTATYAFFNYTRTGSANTIKTGRIYFNTTQNGVLNITNLFPMSSTDGADPAKNTQSVSVNIVGDTTYANGEEFEISLVAVNNTVGTSPNEKTLPISYVATYAPAASQEEPNPNQIGSAGNPYASDRGSSSAVYQLNATGTVSEGKQVLVGFIPNGATGINGTLTIRAYLDASNIAISDTYPEQTVRTVNTTGYTAAACETATGLTSGASICASAEALQTELDSGSTLTSNQIAALVTAGLVTEYTDGTTDAWVNGRTVLTTAEWNALQNAGNPVSFKIKAESNEGTWVAIQPALALASSTVAAGSTTTITSNGDGNLSCASSDDNIATCSVSGGTATITGVAEGVATITVSQAAGTDYAAVPSTTYGITVTPAQQP